MIKYDYTAFPSGWQAVARPFVARCVLNVMKCRWRYSIARICSTKDCFSRHIVFLVDGQYLLALEVLTLHLVEQKSVDTGFDIVQHRSGETDRSMLQNPK